MSWTPVLLGYHELSGPITQLQTVARSREGARYRVWPTSAPKGYKLATLQRRESFIATSQL